MNQVDLDPFDAQILNLLQTDNRMTAQNIADVVGLSPAAVQKRLKRLRSGEVITSEIAVVSPKAVGLNLAAIVQVRLSRDNAAELEQFKEVMLNAPEVTQCYYVTGECNFVVMVEIRDMEAYEAFSRKYFIEDEAVTQFVTSVIMDRVKSNGALKLQA